MQPWIRVMILSASLTWSAGTIQVPTKCSTHESPVREAYETHCDDGTAMIHRYSKDLRSWTTTIRKLGHAEQTCRQDSRDGRFLPPSACR